MTTHRSTKPANRLDLRTDYPSRSDEWYKAAAVLVAHPEWPHERVQKTAHTSLHTETMRVMRIVCAVPTFCAYCGGNVPPGRRKLGRGRFHWKYCSDACAKKGKRKRRSERHQGTLSKVSAKELELLRKDPQRQMGKEFVVCLECGGKLKILTTRRGGHLQFHLTTPEQYKEKWPGAPLVSTAFREAVSYPWMGDKKRRKTYSERRKRFWADVAVLRTQVEVGKAAAATLKKIEEGGSAISIGDGRMIVKKLGPTAHIKRAEAVCRLFDQGIKWLTIKEQVEAEFQIYTTIGALQELRRRHIARQKKPTN